MSGDEPLWKPTLPDPDKYMARRVKKDGRIIVLPPDGKGDRWAGSGR